MKRNPVRNRNMEKQLKLPAHRAWPPCRDGSSFVRLTMTAHHDDGNVIRSLPKDPLTPTLSLRGEREIRG